MAVSPDTTALSETFAVVPPATEPISARDQLRLHDALAGGEIAAAPRRRVAIGRTPAIDFAQRRFIPNTSGGPLMLSGRDTLRQWCEMCLRTRRGDCAALPADFGMDLLFTDLLGGSFDAGAQAEFAGVAERALTWNPLIDAVEGWWVDFDPATKAATVEYRIVEAADVAEPLDIVTVLNAVAA